VEGRLAFLCAVGILGVVGCSALPQEFPSDASRKSLVPIDTTRIVVREAFKYSPSLTSIVLPADEYVPVRAGSGGTFYESPRGIMIVPVAGSSYLTAGGIYRSSDPAAKNPLSVYGAPVTWPLHSVLGLNLKTKIECIPKCDLP